MVQAQPSTVGYVEGRVDLNGNKNPAAPATTNFTDFYISLAGYNMIGMDVGAGGQWQFYKKLPLSVGAKFLYQMQTWSSRDEYLLGPTLQYKLGRSVDVTLRLELLADLLEGDMGVVHPYMLIYKQWAGRNTYQLNFQAHYQWQGPDRHELPAGHYVASEHQAHAEIDGAWHPSGWKYIYPLMYAGVAGYWNSSRTYTRDGEFPAGEARGLLNLGLGARGEIPVGMAVLWYQARVGYQGHFGVHHRRSPHAFAFLASLGIYFKVNHTSLPMKQPTPTPTHHTSAPF